MHSPTAHANSLSWQLQESTYANKFHVLQLEITWIGQHKHILEFVSYKDEFYTGSRLWVKTQDCPKILWVAGYRVAVAQAWVWLTIGFKKPEVTSHEFDPVIFREMLSTPQNKNQNHRNKTKPNPRRKGEKGEKGKRGKKKKKKMNRWIKNSSKYSKHFIPISSLYKIFSEDDRDPFSLRYDCIILFI